ncbi:MAG: hypothetical protein AAFY28_11650 [Actinomycetota bacterium]
MNVTAVGATAQTNLRLFPADLAEVPLLSSLNVSAGQAPFPNKVDVTLSPNGAIRIFNQNGNVSVLGDIVGYYTASSLTEIDARLAALEASDSDQDSAIDTLAAAQPFANVGHNPASLTALSTTPQSMVTVPITAPVDGRVTVNWSSSTANADTGELIVCYPDLDSAEPTEVDSSAEGAATFQAGVSGVNGSFSGTAQFAIGAGESRTYALWCEEANGEGFVGARTITAIFTPTP